jgi:hypothetical protein
VEAIITGPKGSYWEGGKFTIQLFYTLDFPKVPPLGFFFFFLFICHYYKMKDYGKRKFTIPILTSVEKSALVLIFIQ